VVVPTLNGARYLPAALASLAAQERQPTESIVVDGGSTDGSVEVIRAWAEAKPGWARWVSEPDRGQADAINKGFAMAAGDIVGWLNADDILEPATLATVAEAFERDPELDFVWGFCLVIDGDGRPLYVQNPFVRDFAALRSHRNFVPQPGSFFRRALVERVGPLDISYEYMFDYEFLLRFAGRVKALFVPSVLARFRLHAGSKTGRAHRAFLREERRAFVAHGGRWLSPFYLDLLRYRLLGAPADRLKAPLRRLVWASMGLPRGSRIRP
jgi:glycosyltransferase involved in cell wall biosynthesis